MHYTERDLRETYHGLGVDSGRVVYVTGNFGRLGLIAGCSKAEILTAHFQVLRELLGEEGTLIVPTHSFSICNTDTPFDVEKTPSETGAFSEFVRRQPGAMRQYHAFSSRVALGAEAESICGDCSSHAYGHHSPFARMIERDALFISVGMPAAHSASIVHQAEFVMGVPYRFTKEFEHPVIEKGVMSKRVFYLYVIHHGVDVIRDKNRKIFAEFDRRFELKAETLGLGRMEAFGMRDFMTATTDLMRDDPYVWLESPPRERPYRR